MHQLYKIPAFLLLFLLIPSAYSQTTMDYFSRPGLNVNAFAINIFGDTSSTSYSYSHKTLVCGDTAVVMDHNTGGGRLFLVFEGQKVYRTDYSCIRTILYDFGKNVGSVMIGGPYDDMVVTKKHDVTLLNGEMRLLMELELNGGRVTWIEGIGDIENGFFSNNDFESYQFVCARDSTGDLWIDPDFADQCDKYGCRRPRPEFMFAENGLSINLLNDSKFANQYEWDFGDGSFASSWNATHTYSQPGCYTATLTVRNECYPDSIVIQEAVPVCIGFNWDTLSTIDFVENFTLKAISDSLHFLIRTYPYDMFFRSTDGARTWHEIELPPIEEGETRSVSDLEMYDDQRGILVTSGSNSDEQAGVFTTNDGGETWTPRGLENVSMGYLELGKNGIAYATGGLYVHKSEDYGETWTELTSYIRRINELWNFGDTVLIAVLHTISPPPAGEDYIVKSYDGGYTWDTISIPDHFNWIFFLSPEIAIGAHSNKAGVYKSYDGGHNWVLHLPEVRLFGLNMFDENTGWMADYTGILYYTNDAFETIETIKCGPKYLFGISPESSSSAIVTDGRHLLSFKGSIGFPCLDPDNDGDGYYGDADCDDNNFNVNPAVVEIPDNGIDDDCDGTQLVTATHEIQETPIRIYPNPGSDIIFIETETEMNFDIRIFDSRGILLDVQRATYFLDVSNLINGMYYLEIINEDKVHTMKKIVIMR